MVGDLSNPLTVGGGSGADWMKAVWPEVIPDPDMKLINDCYICHVIYKSNKGTGATKTFKALVDIQFSRQVCKVCASAIEKRKATANAKNKKD